jgi:hypothetical protein
MVSCHHEKQHSGQKFAQALDPFSQILEGVGVGKTYMTFRLMPTEIQPGRNGHTGMLKQIHGKGLTIRSKPGTVHI